MKLKPSSMFRSVLTREPYLNKYGGHKNVFLDALGRHMFPYYGNILQKF